MGENSKIEWTDATWNPIGGCSIKSPGCAPCYAQQLVGTRLKHHPLYAGTTDVVKGKPVFNGTLTIAAYDHPVWTWPIGWRGAKAPRLGAGKPSLIFVGDMSDLFHENRSVAAIDKVVAPILYSRHVGQLLTKRAPDMRAYFDYLRASSRWRRFLHPSFGESNFAVEATFENAVLPRLWLGVSAERQREFDERWPHLRALAAMGFTVYVSYEPAIGPLILPADFLALGKRAQVIAGGMSGREATPAHPDWFRSVRDQCGAAAVPFFFKQWGEWRPPIDGEAFNTAKGRAGKPRAFILSANGTVHCYNSDHIRSGQPMLGVGKKAAGRLLDGEEWNQFPK